MDANDILFGHVLDAQGEVKELRAQIAELIPYVERACLAMRGSANSSYAARGQAMLDRIWAGEFGEVTR